MSLSLPLINLRQRYFGSQRWFIEVFEGWDALHKSVRLLSSVCCCCCCCCLSSSSSTIPCKEVKAVQGESAQRICSSIWPRLEKQWKKKKKRPVIILFCLWSLVFNTMAFIYFKKATFWMNESKRKSKKEKKRRNLILLVLKKHKWKNRQSDIGAFVSVD